MSPEKTEQLIKAFPLLYRDVSRPMTQSLMCFGFECGDGWFQLVWDLSEKLEALIREYLEEYPDLPCANCGHGHYRVATGGHVDDGPCHAIDRISFAKYGYRSWLLPNNAIKKFFFRCWLALRYGISGYYNKLAELALDLFNLGRSIPCQCQAYVPNHPRACQVKEKFAELRFYMTGATDDMYALIDKAERLSSTVCEHCSAAAKVRTVNGWWFTLCDICVDKRSRN